MIEIIEKKDTSQIDGIVKTTKLNFQGCININCPLLYKCSNQNPIDIYCKFGNDKSPIKVSYTDPSHEEYLENGYFHNTTPTELKTSMIELLFGLTTPNLKVNYVALSSAYDESNIFNNELTRKAPTTAVNGNSGTSTVNFTLAEANNKRAIIQASPSPTSKIFTVDDSAGFIEGDFLNIFVASSSKFFEAKLLDITGNQLTIDRDIAVPSVNDYVQQITRFIILIANGTESPATGTKVSIAKNTIHKSSADNLNIVHNIVIN